MHLEQHRTLPRVFFGLKVILRYNRWVALLGREPNPGTVNLRFKRVCGLKVAATLVKGKLKKVCSSALLFLEGEIEFFSKDIPLKKKITITLMYRYAILWLFLQFQNETINNKTGIIRK